MKLLLNYIPTQILIGLVLGILLPINRIYAGILLLTCFLLYLTIWIRNNRTYISSYWYFTIILIFSYAVGSLNVVLNSSESSIQFFKNSKHLVTFSVDTRLNSNQYYHRYYIKLHTIDSILVDEKVLLEQRVLEDNILWEGKKYKAALIFKKLPYPISPYHFNYSNYLHQHHIHLRTRAYEKVRCIGNTQGLVAKIQRIRNHLAVKIDTSHLKSKTKDILYGFILGIRTEISPETYQNFINTGVIHLLSISGMHVGVVFWVLAAMLYFLKSRKYGKWIYTIIIIAIIWGYALFSGFSISVVRAAVMISFYIIGNLKKSPRCSFEGLLASMLFLLLIDPNYLYDVGFQLSYLAIAAIIFLYPLLKKYFSSKNFIIKYFTDILLISVVAQILVLPLTLYYFHQFPLSFLIANVFAVAFLPFVFYGGILVIALLFVDVNWSHQLINVYEKVGLIYLNCIEDISTLDWIVPHIYLSRYQLWASYLLLFITLGIMYYKKYYILFPTVLIVLWRGNPAQKNNDQLIFLNTKKLQWIMFCDQKISTNQPNNNAVRKMMEPIVYKLGVNKICFNMPNTFIYKNKRYRVIDSISAKYSGLIKGDKEILIIDKNPKINFERLLINNQPQQILFSADNYQYLLNKWKETCQKRQVPYIVIGEKNV